VRFRSILRRRPSAPMVVSLVALFMSVGGVGYAAISLPADSVGSTQIRDEAVTYKKIRPNSVGAVRLADRGVTNSKLRDGSVSYKKIQARAVGKVRANLDQLQARIATACAAGSAIGAVDNAGKPTCSFPAQVGVNEKAAAAVGATAAAINSVALPAGSNYLVFANPGVTVTAGSGNVTVTCTLTDGTSAQSRSMTVPTAGGSGSLALQITGGAGTASVSCSATGGTGTASATSAINALHING
jgi:hypothetical protein